MLPIQPTLTIRDLSPGQLGQVLRDVRPILEVNPTPARLPDLKPGEQVSARVVDNLAGNRFLVLVKNQLLTLNLGRGQMLAAEPGATLKLTVAQVTPRLSFRLESEPVQEQSDRQLSRVTLSGASRYLGALLTQASRGAEPSVREPLLPQPGQRPAAGGANAAPTPAATQLGPIMLANGQVNTRALAGALQQMLSGSGTFYEAHLAEWVQGKRTLEQVRAEPQAKLELPKATLALLHQQRTDDDPAQATGKAADEVDSARHQNANAALGQLVARQLDTLEHRQVLMQGAAWPEQPFEWLIEEDKTAPDREADGREEAPRRWVSRLALNLPSLGAIEARITLDGQGVQIRMDALDPRTAARIAAERDRLQHQLSETGLTLLQYSVNREAT